MNFLGILQVLKDLSLVFAIIGGSLAIIINWKTIFRPYSKKLEDNRFEASVALLKAILDPTYYAFYTIEEDLPAEVFQKIVEPLATALQSPFLPSALKQEGSEFWKIFMTNAGWQWMLGLQKDNSKFDIISMNRQEIIKAHESLYKHILAWLKYKESNFLFTLNSTKS